MPTPPPRPTTWQVKGNSRGASLYHFSKLEALGEQEAFQDRMLLLELGEGRRNVGEGGARKERKKLKKRSQPEGVLKHGLLGPTPEFLCPWG